MSKRCGALRTKTVEIDSNCQLGDVPVGCTEGKGQKLQQAVDDKRASPSLLPGQGSGLVSIVSAICNSSSQSNTQNISLSHTYRVVLEHIQQLCEEWPRHLSGFKENGITTDRTKSSGILKEKSKQREKGQSSSGNGQDTHLEPSSRDLLVFSCCRS